MNRDTAGINQLDKNNTIKVKSQLNFKIASKCPLNKTVKGDDLD
jgi:hypothetical protein